MPVVVYNPKYLERDNERGERVYKPSAPIRDFTWSKARWSLGINKIMKFPNEVGEALLKIYPWLERVTGRNIQEIKKRMETEIYKCKYCDFTTTAKIGLEGHMKSHKLTEEDKVLLSDVDEAEPGDFKPTGKIRPEDIEKKAGIQGKDYYGPGLERDTLTDMKAKIPGKTPGVFGG